MFMSLKDYVENIFKEVAAELEGYLSEKFGEEILSSSFSTVTQEVLDAMNEHGAELLLQKI